MQCEYAYQPRSKNYSDQTCSCPRDWRLSATIYVQFRTPPETPGTITALYRIEGFKGALNWSPIMPRDASLSDSRCEVFQSRLFYESVLKEKNNFMSVFLMFLQFCYFVGYPTDPERNGNVLY